MHDSTRRTTLLGGREGTLLTDDGSKIILGHRGLTLRECVYVGHETAGNAVGVFFRRLRTGNVMKIRHYIANPLEMRASSSKEIRIDKWKSPARAP